MKKIKISFLIEVSNVIILKIVIYEFLINLDLYHSIDIIDSINFFIIILKLIIFFKKIDKKILYCSINLY